jgi:hypothetical protein
MTRKKPIVPATDSETAKVFDELFAGGDDSREFDYHGLDHNKLGRLAAECCRLGLLFSAYYSSTDQLLVCSIRAGERKRAYQYANSEEFNLGVDLLVKQLMAMVKGGGKKP